MCQRSKKSMKDPTEKYERSNWKYERSLISTKDPTEKYERSLWKV